MIKIAAKAEKQQINLTLNQDQQMTQCFPSPAIPIADGIADTPYGYEPCQPMQIVNNESQDQNALFASQSSIAAPQHDHG